MPRERNALMRRPSTMIIVIFAAVSLAADRAGSAEIHEAVRKGNLAEVKSILQSADTLLNAPDIIGHTPLSLSAAYAQWEIFQYLLEAGADVNIITKANATPMHSACQYNRPDMVKILFDRGGAPCMDVRDVFGEYTPMLRAVQRGCGDVVAFLFERGADPDEATKEGWNALHLAAKCGHRHLYDMLVEKGVSQTARDNEGKAPMEYDWRRPEAVGIDPKQHKDYVGRYVWKGAPEGLGVRVFIQDGCLILDDYSLNELYAIDTDTFYCSRDPWKVMFYRNDEDDVERIELFFLRRSVVLDRDIQALSRP